MFTRPSADATMVDGARTGGTGTSLQAGTLVANRYEIVKRIGEGGMGAVYVAEDREIGRKIALKVIRPDMASDPKILERFKQELILSRQISHRNVIRIFDMGVEDQIKFITMEYIEGRDLSDVMEDRRLSLQECVNIARQVLLALDAANSEGVTHRDLKPQNIMINTEGRIWVLDFGLARTMESQGMTHAGMVLGTPTYMSPEQASGEKADHRSDLFSFGVMFYEMLTGVVPYRAETILASLLKRTQVAPAPPISENPDLPEGLNQIVMKCLTIDKTQRYQKASEVLTDLDFVAASLDLEKTQAVAAVQAGISTAAVVLPSMVGMPSAPVQPVVVPSSRRTWIVGGAGAAVLVGAGGWLLMKNRFSGALKTPPTKAVSVLVSDFDNETSDPVFDGALEPTFIFAMEGAGFVTAYNRANARRLAAQLQPGTTKLDEKAGRLVAMREGIGVLVGGVVRKSGNEFQLAVRATDAVTGKPLMKETSTKVSREKILAAAGKMAAAVRTALGDVTPESLQLAAAETFTAASLEAAQTYSKAQEARFAGKAEEAIRLFQETLRLDPNMAVAYYSLGVTYSNLGQRGDAEKYYKNALSHIDRMSAREKYRTRGAYYLTALNHEKAAEEFRELARLFPADTAALSNLAYVEYLRRDMNKALASGKRALEVYPKNSLLRSNYAMYALYSGDFSLAQKEAEAVIAASPTYLKAHNTRALAELAQNRPANAIAGFEKMQSLDKRGASFAAMGLADVALYEGRIRDASALLEKGAAADLESQNTAGGAKKLGVLSSTLLTLGRIPAAMAAADRALSLRKEEIVCYEAARVYLEAGQPAKAAAIAKMLTERLETDPQLYAKLIDGEILLKKNQHRDAIRSFQEAQRIADTWLGRLSLGRAYLAAASYAEANSEFDICKARKGEVVELFLDEVQTMHYYPQIEYYVGRTREGLNSSGAHESYQAFLNMKKPDSDDPMVADARRRLARR
ncbi:MAG: protein kinase [Acidobacteria bacterium]|nr:protein kinase [Acidobacteriota bacterium]